MGGLRQLSLGLTFAAVAAAALAPTAMAGETCSKQSGRTLVKDAHWRVFDKPKKGVRRYAGTVRHSIRVCRRGGSVAKQIAAWTDSREDRTWVDNGTIAGDWAVIGGEYRTGVAAGTYAQVVLLTTPSRRRIEGPLADRVTDIHLSPFGAVAFETTAAGIPSLDVYDGAGRRTLAMGEFSEVWIGGDTVFWRDPGAIRSARLDGPATNDVDTFAAQ